MFRALFDQADPRPAYYAFVRHWVAGVVKDRFPALYARLPVDFGRGVPLPERIQAA